MMSTELHRYVTVALLGSARAPACAFRRPRRNVGTNFAKAGARALPDPENRALT